MKNPWLELEPVSLTTIFNINFEEVLKFFKYTNIPTHFTEIFLLIIQYASNLKWNFIYYKNRNKVDNSYQKKMRFPDERHTRGQGEKFSA